MEIPNGRWRNLINAASQNPSSLITAEAIRELISVLRIFTADHNKMLSSMVRLEI